jgi:pimeloyl-ACP methyl ester carboxylesterase
LNGTGARKIHRSARRVSLDNIGVSTAVSACDNRHVAVERRVGGACSRPGQPSRHRWVAAAVATLLGASGALSAACTERGPAHARDSGAKYLFYLHGRIVQTSQSPRPVHPRFGPYEYEAILAAFRERGFMVFSEIRPRDSGVDDYAQKVADKVRALLDAGVPPQRITIVGASMGGAIALSAAATIAEPRINVALLAGCFAPEVASLRGHHRAPMGHVLSFREASDDIATSCRDVTAAFHGLELDDEIVLHTGLAHGFIYRPLPEWVEPLVAWTDRRVKTLATPPTASPKR